DKIRTQGGRPTPEGPRLPEKPRKPPVLRENAGVRVWTSRRSAGWLLVGVGLIVFCAAFEARAAGAHDDTRFNRLVGWANIFGFAVAAVGVALVTFARAPPGRRAG